MSHLKHLTVEQLKAERVSCKEYISKLRSNLNGQEQKLEWINNYIFEKTPQCMSIEMIESALGHKVIIT
jgi:hypothetical protein